MLRTQCFSLSVLDAVARIHLFCYFNILSHNFLTRTLWWWLISFTSVHCSLRTYSCCLQVKYTSCGCETSHCCLLLSLSSLLSCCISPRTDLLWHYASWSFTLYGLCRSGSAQWASVTLCFNALFEVRLCRCYERYPKAKIQIFNFWQIQIPKKSLFPVYLFFPFCPAACVLRDKPSTGFSPSLSNSKA